MSDLFDDILEELETPDKPTVEAKQPRFDDKLVVKTKEVLLGDEGHKVIVEESVQVPEDIGHRPRPKKEKLNLMAAPGQVEDPGGQPITPREKYRLLMNR